MSRTASGIIADVSATSSFTAASFAWIAPVTDVLQLVATIVAITTGLYAIRWHRIRINIAKEKARATSTRDSSGRAARSSSEDSAQRD